MRLALLVQTPCFGKQSCIRLGAFLLFWRSGTPCPTSTSPTHYPRKSGRVIPKRGHRTKCTGWAIFHLFPQILHLPRHPNPSPCPVSWKATVYDASTSTLILWPPAGTTNGGLISGRQRRWGIYCPDFSPPGHWRLTMKDHSSCQAALSLKFLSLGSIMCPFPCPLRPRSGTSHLLSAGTLIQNSNPLECCMWNI